MAFELYSIVLYSNEQISNRNERDRNKEESAYAFRKWTIDNTKRVAAVKKKGVWDVFYRYEVVFAVSDPRVRDKDGQCCANKENHTYMYVFPFLLSFLYLISTSWQSSLSVSRER